MESGDLSQERAEPAETEYLAADSSIAQPQSPPGPLTASQRKRAAIGLISSEIKEYRRLIHYKGRMQSKNRARRAVQRAERLKAQAAANAREKADLAIRLRQQREIRLQEAHFLALTLKMANYSRKAAAKPLKSLKSPDNRPPYTVDSVNSGDSDARAEAARSVKLFHQYQRLRMQEHARQRRQRILARNAEEACEYEQQAQPAVAQIYNLLDYYKELRADLERLNYRGSRPWREQKSTTAGNQLTGGAEISTLVPNNV